MPRRPSKAAAPSRSNSELIGEEDGKKFHSFLEKMINIIMSSYKKLDE